MARLGRYAQHGERKAENITWVRAVSLDKTKPRGTTVRKVLGGVGKVLVEVKNDEDDGDDGRVGGLEGESRDGGPGVKILGEGGSEDGPDGGQGEAQGGRSDGRSPKDVEEGGDDDPEQGSRSWRNHGRGGSSGKERGKSLPGERDEVEDKVQDDPGRRKVAAGLRLRREEQEEREGEAEMLFSGQDQGGGWPETRGGGREEFRRRKSRGRRVGVDLGEVQEVGQDPAEEGLMPEEDKSSIDLPWEDPD